MAGNQVVLTFAGETKNLEQSFSRVGGSARDMGDKVRDAGSGFDRVGEAADGGERKAQGFADTIDGTQGILSGFSTTMKGDVAGGLIEMGRGVADLAGGMADFLVPALKASRVGTLASAVAQKVAAGASKAWAAAQWLMNGALLASPITWIVVGIVALIAVIVLIATKTTWFQTAWRVAWGAIKTVASGAWNFIKQIPGWIGSAFSRVSGLISAPFRAAFNFVADAWNNTVGQLSFSIPSWVPGIGGNGFSVPKLPHFHAGGVVPGVVGTEVMAVLQAGERVGSVASSGGEQHITLQMGNGVLGDVIIDALRGAIRTRGGLQAALG